MLIFLIVGMKSHSFHPGFIQESKINNFFYCVGPASFVWSQTPLVGWVASTCVHDDALAPGGGLSSAGVLKSKNSLISRDGSCQYASRAVSACTPKVSSIKARMAV